MTKVESPAHFAKAGSATSVEPRQSTAVRDVALTALAWTLGAAVFFRAQWTSRFRQIMGNGGDARLIVYLNEHWYLVLRGRQSWLNPAFYYPIKGVLGWSDTVLLYQVFYAPLRAAGLDPFLAFQLTIILLSLVGFAGFVLLVRLTFGAPLLPALAGALVFTFANNLWLHAGSPQLFGIYLIPPVAVLGVLAWRNLETRPVRAIVLSALFGLSYALVLFTTYYMAWLSLLAAGVVVGLALVGAPRLMARGLVKALHGWRSVVAALAGFGAGIVPFLITYLPVARATGGRRYADVLGFAPSWRDVFNLGYGNLVWGSLLRHLRSGRPVAYEVTYAVTPLLLLVLVVGGVAVVVRRPRPSGPKWALLLAVAALVLVIAPIETSFGSLWAIVWHLPGGSAIRAIDRLQVVTNLVAALAVVALATEVAKRRRPRRPSLLAVAVAAAIVVLVVGEQVNTTKESYVDRGLQVAFLRSARPAPGACTSFFVTDARNPPAPPDEYQVDAMLISERIGLPTINGYTGYSPPGWTLDSPEAANYRAAVRSWADQHGIAGGLCQLELSTMTWVAQP